MIYTAPCVIVLMRADTLRGEVGGIGAGNREFFGPLRRVSFQGIKGHFKCVKGRSGS
jgi:hypothetical protein